MRRRGSYILRIDVGAAKEDRVVDEIYCLDAVGREPIDTIVETFNLVMLEDVALI